MTHLFSLPNLSSSSVERVTLNGSAPEIPEKPDSLSSKDDYRNWLVSPTTRTRLFSAFEGLTPGSRIRGDNTAARVHGLIAEYDAGIPEDWPDQVRRRCAEGGYPAPAWACQTFSGNGRLIYTFEEPIPYPGDKIWARFWSIAQKELGLKKMGAGFEPEETKPGQYFEIGVAWLPVVADATVASDLIRGWLIRASKKANWVSESGRVPLERVREEGEKKFPGAWPAGWANFDVGQTGRRFWDPSADNEKGCISNEGGWFCFTGDKSFVSFAEIFGAGFVRGEADKRIGAAIRSVYYDHNTSKYYRKLPGRPGFKACTREDVKMELSQGRGLSYKAPSDGGPSEVDRAIYAVQTQNSVDGTAVGMFQNAELISQPPFVRLNTYIDQLCRPKEGPVRWGEGFPWVAQWIEETFGAEQTRIYLHWLARYYRSALEGKPARAQALFLAGPVSAGKSMHLNGILGQIFGSVGEATNFLLGKDQFNATLFGDPVWCVDDAVASTAIQDRLKFTQFVKAVVANDKFTMRGMHKEGVRMPWQGVLVVNLNRDANSMLMLPSTEPSVMDKLILMVLDESNAIKEGRTDAELREELPYFCAFLRDMPFSAQIVNPKSRFGLLPYHHPSLLAEAEASHESSGPLQLLQSWARYYFRETDEGKKAEFFEGTAADLILKMGINDEFRDMVRREFKSNAVVGKILSQLESRGIPGIKRNPNPVTNTFTYRLGKELAR